MREIEPKWVGGFSENYFTKIKIFHSIFGGISEKSSQIKIKVCNFRFWKPEVACRDGDGSRTRRAILYSTKLQKIVAKTANGFCKNYFTKIKRSLPILGRFCWELYQLKLRGQGLRFWKREVQENSTARERLRPRSGWVTRKIGNLTENQKILTFLERRWEASRKLLACLGSLQEYLRVPRSDFKMSHKVRETIEIWLVETEMDSVLEEQYFIAQRRGNSKRRGPTEIAKSPKILLQKWRYLEVCSVDFVEIGTRWS